MNIAGINKSNIKHVDISDSKIGLDNRASYFKNKTGVEKYKKNLSAINFDHKTLLYSPLEKDQTSKTLGNTKTSETNRVSTWDILSQRITDNDIKLLDEEGVPYKDYNLEQLESAIERIKENKVETKERVEDHKDSKKEKIESIKEYKGLSGIEKQIAQELEEKGLPVTRENMAKISNAMEKAILIQDMPEEAMTYLIDNNLSFSINNVYKSMHVGFESISNVDNLDNLESIEHNELISQLSRIIEDTGLEVNDETLKDANMLLKYDVPVTVENLWKVQDFKLIKSELTMEDVLNLSINNLYDGENPETADLSLIPYKRLDNTIKEFNAIDQQTIDYIESNKNLDKDLSLQEIKDIDTDIKENNIVDYDNNKASIEIYNDELDIASISLKRNLEEIRLKLTVESGKQLIKSGTNLETDKLSKVIEDLRSIETKYYSNILREANIEDNIGNVNTIKDTINDFDRLKFMPASILGTTFKNVDQQTVTSLLEEGNKHLTDARLVEESYETLMTKPDRYYGDSIHKAFEGIDDILYSLKLEDTEGNKRAIRILGYNEIDINLENINLIKLYDNQINDVLKNTNPHLVVNMIKKGINPLDIPIPDLQEEINNEKSKNQSGEIDKFSKYLWKLDKNNNISESEKESYIGIYRLINQLNNSGEAAIGAVIKAGQELTLNNLLKAIRTRNHGQVDVLVDEQFGMLESNTKNTKDIDIQINEGFIDKINDNISPEKLNQIQANDKDIYNLSVEKLSDELERLEYDLESENEYYAYELDNIKDVISNNSNIINFLDSLNIPTTINNINAATHLISQDSNFNIELRKILNQSWDSNNAQDISIESASEQIMTNFNSYDEINSEYDKFERDIKENIKNFYESDVFLPKDLSTVRMLTNGISFIKFLSEREHYQIPISTGDTVTNVNLTILRNEEEKGKVKVYIPSERLGNITMSFKVDGEELDGLITCDNIGSLELIKEDNKKLTSRFEDMGLTNSTIYYALEAHSTETIISNVNNIEYYNQSDPSSNKLNLINETNKHIEEDVNDSDKSMTSQGQLLYKTAKELLIYIRELERS